MVSEQQKVGLIFAIILLIPTFLPAVYGFLIKPENEIPFKIPLCKVSNEVTIDVAKQEKEKYLNVPDYDAKIFINISKQNYIVDDFADVNVKIQDKGILKLSKPYFYLLVFDPSDKLKEMYPCFINEKEKQFSGSIGTSYVYSHKWAQWVSPTIVLAGNQYSCADKEAFYFYPNNCISRLDLMDGNIINTPIRYTFKITEPGTWKIYVFLFDEEYKSRPNTNLLNEYDKGPVSFQNAVAYGYSEISVKSEIGLIESSGIDLKNLLPVLINALIAGIGYYGIGRKEIYPKLKDIYYNHIKKLKSEILGLLGLLALITIYFLIMLKFVFT